MTTKTKTIKLGDKIRDKITGFEGIFVAYCQHLTGCDTVGIKPQALHDGKTIDERWFDIAQVESVEKSVVVLDVDMTFGGDNSPAKDASTKPRTTARDTGGIQSSPGKRG